MGPMDQLRALSHLELPTERATPTAGLIAPPEIGPLAQIPIVRVRPRDPGPHAGARRSTAVMKITVRKKKAAIASAMIARVTSMPTPLPTAVATRADSPPSPIR